MQAQQLQEALQKILGLPLTKTTRSEQVQYFHFGSTHYTTPQGLVLDIGTYTLAVNCSWHLLQPGGDTIRHSEVFLRKREPGLPSPTFDWKIPGNNLRDQRLKEFTQAAPAPVIERVTLQEPYGLTVFFTNGCELALAPDTTEAAEAYWQLFSNTGDGFSIEAGATGIV